MSTDASDELPEQLFLPPSRMRWVVSVTISIFIVALDAYLAVVQQAPAVWLLVVLFGGLGAFSAVQLIPGSGGLWLDREGFVYRMFWVDRRREWKKISPILGSQVGLLQMVGYHREGCPPNKPREVLPDTYGISANQLAEIMNQWRNAAIRAG